jgi:gliding motility-associated-like protein
VKKSLLSIFVFLLTSNLFSQVLIDQTKTPAQLTVQDLIGNGVTVTNITFNGSAANANVLRNQIALFTNGENSTVGIDRGVVLTTGNSLVAQIGTGFTNPPFAQQGGASSNSTTAVVGDADLSLLVTDDVRNAAVLEFDFVATSAFVEFRYVFASEEYPEYTPCESSDPVNDVFGFFISGPGISGPYSNNATNIALIPGTTLPISINNINQCSAFNSFYVDNAAFIDPNTGLVNPNTVQYDGMTTILTARANVQCGETYHIKIAIANVFDNGFDSAVFLQANSFSIPTVDLGPDRSFCGTATCFDLQATFDQNLPVGFNPSYNWYLNGVLQTTTTVPTLNICQSGEWRVDVFTPGCAAVVATDSVQINFISAVPFNPIGPISGNAGECNPVFNLLSYQAALVAPQDPANFTFVYYDENFDVITDPANFSPISNTIVGIDISVGTCSSFDIVEFIVDCDPVSCSLNLTSATETTNQTICLGETITDITYTFGGDATNVTVVDLPAGVTTTIASGILTISGTPSTTGSFTYTVSSVGCSPELTLQGTITIANAPTFTNLSAVTPICEGEDAVFTLVGSVGATVEYTINGGAIQTETLNAAGEVIITIPAVTANTTIEVSEIAIGSCIVALNETATVVVNPIPAVPTIDVTAPTCVLAGFATITNYDAVLTYTFTPAGPTITAAGLIENMVVGTSYTVTAENTTCTSADSAAFSNAAQLVTPDIPTIAITAPTCLVAGFATITNYVAGMTYDFTPVGPTVDGTGLISGMTFGTSYEVAANNGSCSSINTAPFSIEDILVTPAVPTVATTAPTCTADGFTEITNYDATLTYTFTPAGPTITAAGLIENMVVGTSYTVTAENTTCTSADSTAFSNAAQLVTPDIPTITITAPTCLAAGFTTITNYVAGMTYDFTPAGPTVDGTGLISGMTFGTSYEVAANNGSCSSINTAPFSIEDILVTPAVPTVATTAPTCTADGFTEITNYDATLTYTFTPAGPTITAAGLIENMVVGTSYTVTAENATCTSADSVAFSNAAQLVTPDIPTITITAPTCLAAGFATITNYVAGMTYDFTPVGPTVDGTGLISGMAFGTSYEVAANNGSCSSVNTAPFSIENILVTPAVPTVATTAPTCTADGFTEITNYDATLTYTFTPVGPTITAAGLIENMVVGTSYTVTAENTTCTSADSAAFSNAAQLVTPDVPTIAITAPTCLAAGFATITNYNGALTYTFTPTGPTVGAGGLISGMTVGTSYTVTAGNGTCTSLASTSFSNAAQLPAPVVTSVTNNGPICEGGNIVFTIIGTPNAVVSYSGVVGVPASTVTLNASGQATVTVAGATSNQTITLNTVTNSITGCSATISNTSTATVLPLPTANLSSANPATCSGGSVVLNFTGTPNAIVSFTDGTNNYNVTLDGTGVNNYTTPPISSTTTFTLTSVATTATPSCSQLVGDSVTVVITPRPIMTASPNPLVLCNGATMNLVLNSDVAGTTYTWSASTTNIEGSFVLDGDGTDINQLVQLQDPTVVGFVTIVVIPRANNCDGDAVTIQVVVNPVPEITDVNVSAETICSNNEVSISVVGIPSGLSYTWQAINNNGVTIVGGVTSGTSATGDIDVTLVTTNPLVAGTIQFEITPIRNGCTGVSVVTPVITVNPIPGTPIGLPISEICSGENANLNISVTPLMTGTELDWEVVEAVNITAGYATQGSGVSPILINDILINDTDQQGFIRYRVTSRLNGCIGNTTDFIVRVNPLPRPTLQDGAICVDGSGVTFQTYVLQSGISGAMYDFDWYYNDTLIAGATGNTYTTTQPGTYSLIVTNTITGCISEEVFANVIEVQPATAASASVTDAFSDNATITVSVTDGTGTLLYQLDDEGFQESNVFTGVSAGLHTVTVIDTQGCTYLTIEVLVIDYPPFFTPNGDGFNDTWNIFSLNGQTNVKIYIFDRYGKLLKQISPQGQGWDGRFNGAELPSTDYWFTVDYLENEQPKTFKAHFSLIR